MSLLRCSKRTGARNDVLYFGGDDECVLWTTNTNVRDQLGRPLSLGEGALDGGPSDAWAGGFSNGLFFRIDGTSGATKEQVQLPPGCEPYGLVVDAAGYGWAPNSGGGPLCYFDTRHVGMVGRARDPSFGRLEGYGVALDRDQNVWIGGLGNPNVYTYSDFTGFGLRNFTRPRGSYSWVQRGCLDGGGHPADTRWWRVTWDADVPPNTSLTVRARSGRTPIPDATWGAWTPDFTVSPAELHATMALVPDDPGDPYLQIEFVFATQDKAVTPRLKGFDVAFKCGKIG